MGWLERRIRGAAVPLVLLAAACGTSKGTGPGGNGSIAITISKTTLTIQQGGSDNLTASITRAGGFTGDVAIATTGAPAGVTAAVSDVSTSNGTTTGTITVTVGAAVAAGQYNLTVTASGSGVTSVSKALTLTVTATPAIAITLNPTTLSIDQGASKTTAVTINRTNFAANVDLTLEGAPDGVTGAFNPASTTTNASTLTVDVGVAVATGNYTLTVRATGTGVTAATATLQLTVTAPPPPSFAITTIAPDPVTIAQGAQGDVTITLSRTNFAGNINLALEGAPAGVTGDFNPASVTQTASTLTLHVGAAVAAGNHQLTVRGTATGLTDQVKNFTLTVTAVVTGNYTLTTTPSGTASVQQGANTNVTININRTGGFAGSVALSVTGNPAGLTATPNPASTVGNTSTLTIGAAGNLAVGNYPIVIHGAATGLAEQTVNLTVSVTAPQGGGNVTLDYSACSVTAKPIWVAYQDGSGAWTRAVGNADVYSFNISSNTAGLATVTSGSAGHDNITIFFLSKNEITGMSAGSLCPQAVGTKSVTGTTANLTADQFAFVSLGGGFTSFPASSGAPNFTITGVRNGTFDLLGVASAMTLTHATDKVIIRRGINTTAIADGGSVGPVLDFASGEAQTVAAATITLTNTAGGETVTQSMTYQLATGCTAALLGTGGQVAGTSFTAYGVPAGLQVAGETHGLSVIAATGSTSSRLATEYFQPLADRNFALPDPMPALTPTVLAGSYKRLEFQYTMPTGLTSFGTGSYFDGTAAKVVTMSATQAYLGGTNVDLIMPDFSGLAGFDDSWVPAGIVNWHANAQGGTPASACTAGSRFAAANRSGTI